MFHERLGSLLYNGSVLTYAVLTYAELERVQERTFSIICPNIPNIQALQEANIPTIVDYCEHVCHKIFNSIVNDSENKLFKLLPTLKKRFVRFTKK